MDTTILEKKEIPAPKPNRLVFKNLSEKQKRSLISGGAGLLGLGAGAGLFSLFALPNSADDISVPIPVNPTPGEEEIILYTDAPFASGVSDDMAFNEAFKTAREEVGPGGFFEWHGNTYNTYYKEEWDQMTPDQHQDFMTSVHESIIYPVDDHIDSLSFDENADGIPDAIVVDVDHDGIVDVVVMDTNFDGIPDKYIEYTGENDNLDTVILDDEQAGLEGSEPSIPSSDQDIIIIEDLEDDAIPSRNDGDINYSDPSESLPDLDNDADVSDFS